jgi:hypothetical protein
MKTPWHLWLVGILSLLWNSMGALDYTMTKTKNAAYMGNFTPDQLDYFYSFPAWANLGWAVGVWFAVARSFLLLFRSRRALWSFVLSFLGMITTLVYQIAFAETKMLELMGLGPALFTLAIFVVGLLLIIYARTQKTSGVLT